MSEINGKLLAGVKARTQKRTEYHHGIITADKYVVTVKEAAGLDACYHAASSGTVSFDDVLRKAGDSLVYSNPEMELEEVLDDKGRKKLDLPNNTLMAFRHVLTTTRKDRDGDILRTDGATVDPKMLLLWQHIPTLPIGKMVKVAKQTKNKLEIISAIVDVNAMSHDAAVMVDAGMARFSHGFRALEFEELAKSDDDGNGFPGFDVKRFEIMEASLVSVPSNVDAEVSDVLMSLMDDGKLTSPLMRSVGDSLRAKRPVSVSLAVPEDATKETEDEDEPTVGKQEGEGAGDAEPASGQEDEKAQEAEGASDEEMTQPAEDGGDDLVVEPKSKDEEPDGEKAGRALSKANEARLRSAADAVKQVTDMVEDRAAKALLREAQADLKAVLESVEAEEEEGKSDRFTAKLLGAMFVAEATEAEQTEMKRLLESLEANRKQAERARAVESLLRN